MLLHVVLASCYYGLCAEFPVGPLCPSEPRRNSLSPALENKRKPSEGHSYPRLESPAPPVKRLELHPARKRERVAAVQLPEHRDLEREQTAEKLALEPIRLGRLTRRWCG